MLLDCSVAQKPGAPATLRAAERALPALASSARPALASQTRACSAHARAAHALLVRRPRSATPCSSARYPSTPRNAPTTAFRPPFSTLTPQRDRAAAVVDFRDEPPKRNNIPTPAASAGARASSAALDRPTKAYLPGHPHPLGGDRFRRGRVARASGARERAGRESMCGSSAECTRPV